jgi:outer membrane protein
MKRIMMIVAAVLAVVVQAAAAEAQQLRIGYIDSDRIVAEAPAFAGVRQTLEQEVAPLREELRLAEAELQAADEALQTPTLPEAARQQRQQTLQQQFARYQERRNQIQQLVTAREQELLAPVMQRIREVLEEVRAAGNYTFIIDPPEGFIVAVDPTVDVTNEVLRRLTAGN